MSTRLLTFKSGGWVLWITGLICLLVAAWAMTPAIMRSFKHAPGDGKNIDSYGFDLSKLTAPRSEVAAATLHRDMVPVMDSPTASGPEPVDAKLSGIEATRKRWEKMQRRNDPKYGKYLVPSDRVIGVEVNGECRAYPISVMYVHEIINDTLGGMPIAVTYNWLCDSICVFERRLEDRTLTFGASGLVYNSNMLMYDRHGDDVSQSRQRPESSLWLQLDGRAISGPAAGTKLTRIPAERMTWAQWIELHAQTTVLDRNLSMTERYKDAAPTRYFNSDELWFPVRPMPSENSIPAKTSVLAVIAGESRRVYPVSFVINKAYQSGDKPGEWSDQLGSTTVRFICDRQNQTVRVQSESPIEVVQAYWFAWHAMHPDDQLISASDN